MNKGEIWLVEIPSANGHEQTGTRPAVIVADTTANVAVVVPFTSNIQALRFPHTLEVKPTKSNGLSTVSTLLLFQLRAIDKKRLKKNIGKLDDAKINELDQLLKRFLSL